MESETCHFGLCNLGTSYRYQVAYWHMYQVDTITTCLCSFLLDVWLIGKSFRIDTSGPQWFQVTSLTGTRCMDQHTYTSCCGPFSSVPFNWSIGIILWSVWDGWASVCLVSNILVLLHSFICKATVSCSCIFHDHCVWWVLHAITLENWNCLVVYKSKHMYCI